MNAAEWPWVEAPPARSRKAETLLGLAVLLVRLSLSCLHAIGRAQGWPCTSCPAPVTAFPQFSITSYGGRVHVVDVEGDVLASFDDPGPAVEFLEQLELATRGP